MKAEAYLRLLNNQQLPKNGRWNYGSPGPPHCARTRPSAVHRPAASEGWRKSMARDGVFQFASLERPDRASNAHTARGWSIAVAVRKPTFRRRLGTRSAGRRCWGRNIRPQPPIRPGHVAPHYQPIAELQQKAPLLLSDPESPTPEGLPELEDLSEALKRFARERNRSEQALRQSEERFRGIFKHAATGIAITDLKGRYKLCNPAYVSMLGYSADDIETLNFRNVVHPEDLKANKAQICRLLAQISPHSRSSTGS